MRVAGVRSDDKECYVNRESGHLHRIVETLSLFAQETCNYAHNTCENVQDSACYDQGIEALSHINHFILAGVLCNLNRVIDILLRHAVRLCSASFQLMLHAEV